MVSVSNSKLMIRLLFCTFLLGACTGNDEGRTAPPDTFFFPTGVVVSPDARWAVVTNGNTDLRFNGGTVVMVDMQAAVAAYKNGQCTDRDPIDNRIVVCDQKPLIDIHKTFRLGNFPGQPAIQQFLKPTGAAIERGSLQSCTPSAADPNCIPQYEPDPSQGFRLLIPVRGDPSLTWINVAPDGTPDCEQSPGLVGQCAVSHRVTQLTTNLNQTVVYAPEPFGVAVSNEMGLAMTSHLAAATVSLFDLGDHPEMHPQFVDVLNAVFDPNAQGAQAAYGVALRPLDPTLIPTTCAGLPGCTMGDYELFFATSRVSARLAQLVARGGDLCRPELCACGADKPGTHCGPHGEPCKCGDGGEPCSQCNPGYRGLALVESTQVRLDVYLADGSDVRDIKFTKDGSRAYVVDRAPPSVIEIDTTSTPPPAGDPRDVILHAVEVCPQPSLLALREDPGPLRVYVTCFAAGQIFVVDPLAVEVVDVINVGRGPNAVTPFQDATLGTLGIVANFADNDLSVVDLAPGSPTENTVLFKIGMPNP
jgi:hypothetical protein